MFTQEILDILQLFIRRRKDEWYWVGQMKDGAPVFYTSDGKEHDPRKLIWWNVTREMPDLIHNMHPNPKCVSRRWMATDRDAFIPPSDKRPKVNSKRKVK